MPVTLTNQSFMDAGGKDLFPDLEMRSIISVISSHSGKINHALDSANAEMKEEAEMMEYTHVFGIEYNFMLEEEGVYSCSAIGTGYNSRRK
jgi:hypothetical protein